MNLIILDRDGVINYESESYIKSPEEWIPIPGSLAAIAQLNKFGFTVAVATNQSGLARGLYSEEILAAIHKRMQTELAKVGGHIDYIAYCPHHPDDNCFCRKPKTGLLEEIAQYFQITLTHVPFIGDTFRDVQAARTIGCLPILVKTGYGAKTLLQHEADLTNTQIFPDLAHAVKNLCKAHD